MSPKEVQGLQALAMAHGGSLTINPETGLPEAGFLENILPAVAGFALNAFAPGVGTAVGGMLGLGGAAGTALTVGGIAGLASGSLEKGIMAGMGAYGGAGLSGSMMNTGANEAVRAAEAAIPGGGPLPPEAVAAARQGVNPMDSLKSGFSAAASNPKDFLQDNKYLLGAALLPALMGGDKEEGTQAPERKKYNMNYVKDPVTGALYDTSGEGVTYGGVGKSTRGMADGGDVNSQVAYDTRTDSQKALAYLMGEEGATNPMLFTHKQATGPIEPADMLTRKGGRYILDSATNAYVWVPDAAAPATAGLDALNNQNRGGRDKVESQNPTWDAMTDFEKAGYFGQNPNMAKLDKIVTGVLGSSLLGGGLRAFNPEGFALREAQQKGPEAYLAYMGSDILNPTVQKEALHKESEGPMNTDTSPVGPAAPAAPAGKPGETAVGGTGYGGFDNSGPGAGYGMTASGGYDGSMYSQGGITSLAGGGITGSGNLDLNIPLNVGGGGGGGGGSSGGSYPFANFGGAAQPSFTGQNNTAGGGYANPFASSAGAGAPPSSPGMNLDPQGIFSDTFESKNVGVQNMPAAISQLFGVLGGKDQGSTLGSNAMAQGGNPQRQFAVGGIADFAGGGLGDLGGYSDGGQLLKGPGDGVSDSIPARIGRKQPARLADGEFVIPARIVSELGNGSTDAGARELYKMMARIQAGRKKTVGKNKTAVNSKSVRHLPA
jgi:hypothetical protein